ncbi:MAG: hypothetical protein J7J98_02815 [candidate division Zixibacteria bacterium]|nr:hypothetical protein [candidate division Zixibacteria bacterium]
MKRHILVAMTFCLALILVVGCSDDDECPTCPAFVQKLIVYGQTTVDGSDLYLYTYVFDVDGDVPEVDSVKIDGNLCQTQTAYEAVPIFVAGHEGPAGSLASGDNVSITIYAPTGSGTATVKLLDDDNDAPVGFNHPTDSPYDTVAIGDSIVVSWSPVANADWYGVYRSYSYDSSGTHAYWSEQTWQTTTSITVPASSVSYNGYYYFSVMPSTGPRPDQAGNVSGSVVKGTINSMSDESLNVYVGTGDAYPGPTVSQEDDPGPDYLKLQMSGL